MIDKLVFRFFLFFVPVFLLFIFLELYAVLTPNSFNKKVRFIKKNKDIVCLFFGSSHTQQTINPEFMSIKSANMAYAGQDLQIDSALFFSLIGNFHFLKYVVIEIDYHRLEERKLTDYFRYSWYYYYYNINIPKLRMVDKFLLYPSSSDYFDKTIRYRLNPKRYKYEINEYGFITNDSLGIFPDNSFNEETINNKYPARLKNRHKVVSNKDYIANIKSLRSIISYCNKNSIKVFLLKNPLYATYRSIYIDEKVRRRDLFLDSLRDNSNCMIIDFENSELFSIRDFNNDDHMNPSGAKKFTEIVNVIIENSKSTE